MSEPVIRVRDLVKRYGTIRAVDALRQVMVGGAPFTPLWICVAVLVAWLVACFGFAARTFRWQ